MNSIQLFCIPYAGSSAYMYYKWKELLEPEIHLLPVELTGRGRRLGEPLYESFHDAVNDVFSFIEKSLKNNKYAIFGHSMGSMLAFEVMHKIMNKGIKRPECLFFSGKSAPQIKNYDDKIYHKMNDEEFRNEIIKLGATIPEIFNQNELKKIFVPVIRNDCRIIEEYEYVWKDNPFESEIIILYGKDEYDVKNNLDAWRIHTVKQCSFYEFEGDHFFLNKRTYEIIQVIKKHLAVINNFY